MRQIRSGGDRAVLEHQQGIDRLVGTHAAPRAAWPVKPFVELTLAIPVDPFDPPFTTQEIAELEGRDGDGNATTSVQNFGSFSILADQEIGAGPFQAPLLTLGTSGDFPLTDGVVLPLPAEPPIRTPTAPPGDGSVVEISGSRSVFAPDTLTSRGMVMINIPAMDNPGCTIPALPPVDAPALPGLVGAIGPVGIPSLSQWGMILFVLLLMTLATWTLAGQPALSGAGAVGGSYPPSCPSAIAQFVTGGSRRDSAVLARWRRGVSVWTVDWRHD